MPEEIEETVLETSEKAQDSKNKSFAEKFEAYILSHYPVLENVNAKFSPKEKRIVDFLLLQIHPSQLYQFKKKFLLYGLVIPASILIISYMLSFSMVQIFLSLVAGLVAYLVYYYYVANILEIVYELEKLYSYQEALNFIQYLVMNLRLNPNLERAIENSVKYVHGCFGRDLRQKLKEIELNPLLTAQDLLDHVTSKWGDIIPGLKSSLNLVKASIIEKEYSRRQELLDNAINEISDAIYLDISKKIKSLRQPSMALFYMGVLLPVLLAILYPILVFTPLSILSSKSLAIALFWYVLPSLLILFVTFFILQRPIIYSKSYIEIDKNLLKTLGIYMLLFGIISVVLISVFNNPMVLSIPVVLISILLSRTLLLRLRKKHKEIQELKIIESEFTDTLYLISTKLNQARPIEEAIEYVIEMLPKYHITQKLYKPMYELFMRTGASIEQILFSEEFNLASEIKSDLILNSLKTLINATKLGPRTSSSIVSSIIEQISKIRKTNEMISDLFSEIASAMNFLSVFVAPFTLGIVSGLYSISVNIVKSLARSALFSGNLGTGITQFLLGINLTGVSLANLPSPAFMAFVLEIYTIVVVIVLTLYSSYIEEGPVIPEILYKLGKNLILAGLFYSIGIIMGSLFMGSL